MSEFLVFFEITGYHSGEYEDDLSSGMLRREVSKKLTDVSGMFTASIIRADDGGSKHL
jgi:hypothetical protein